MSESRRLRIGVWLELPLSSPLRGDETFAQLFNLVKNVADQDRADWLFAIPVWAKEPLQRMLAEHKIRPESCEFLLSRSAVPLLARARLGMARNDPSNPNAATGLFGKFRLVKRARSLAARVASMSRMKLAVAAAACLLAAGAFVIAGLGLSFAFAMPIVAFCLLALFARSRFAISIVATSSIKLALAAAVLSLVALATGILFIMRFTDGVAIAVALGVGASVFGGGILAIVRRRHIASTVMADLPFLEATKKKVRFARSVLGRVRRKVGSKLHNLLHDHEMNLLERAAAKRNDVDLWYLPHLGFSRARRLNKPIVVAVADLVHVDFPTAVPWGIVLPETECIRELVAAAALVVSQSEYVRREHVVGFLGKPLEQTVAIPRAPASLAAILEPSTATCGGRSRDGALFQIRSFLRGKYPNPSWAPAMPEGYLRDFPFDEAPFLFVSSRIRPHKNFLNLFRAFETVLRTHRRSLKLFMTGNLDEPRQQPLRDFLLARRLEHDVISLPRMPTDALAAFHHLAALTVVPSLFAAAFPSAFSESVSVETPIVMSSNPTTREVIPTELQTRMLFDPYDVDSIAAAILHGLDHREELLVRQKALNVALHRRTRENVVDEYLAAFAEACRPKEASTPFRKAA